MVWEHRVIPEEDLESTEFDFPGIIEVVSAGGGDQNDLSRWCDVADQE